MAAVGDFLNRGTSPSWTTAPRPVASSVGVGSKSLYFVSEYFALCAIINPGDSNWVPSALYQWDGGAWVSRATSFTWIVDPKYGAGALNKVSSDAFIKAPGTYPEWRVDGYRNGPLGSMDIEVAVRFTKPYGVATGDLVYYYNNSNTASQTSRVDSAYKTNAGVFITPSYILNLTD